MPILNGLQLYKKIKEMDRSVKVMLLTASHEQFDIDKELKLQKQLDFRIVRKPVTISKLVQEINAMLKSQYLINSAT